MLKSLGLTLLTVSSMVAQNAAPSQGPGFKPREAPQAPVGSFSIAPGTHILLNMVNSVSTKSAQVGDRLYLETAFPVLSGNKIVIPQGSWVTGTIIQLTRAKRPLRRGEMQVRFDSLTLPNGVNRDFRSDLGALDPRDGETLNRENNNLSGGSSKGDAAKTVATTTAAGGALGAGIGAAKGGLGKGLGVGLGVGAAAGVATILLTHGSEATLSKGSTVEMVLDRSLTFQTSELDFSNAPARSTLSEGGPHGPPQRRGWTPGIPW